ncbi:uncharacterized protein B0I36DRAFT_369210 [Microdochium trichocladiopsis]|uniref:NACHT domain-containing protein n=1 Tax=Microdochium trichocladiopsis TaxID=1682393 RepID=A0A9P8XS35_9PEZI|nr:uncharacterized protein B0I36DRAFT_369210 [Microdochium trichocladiopsis]KAH7014231.1 hypothetical protein B0I36DRAFT_369210 [Microdochium trichocladiopsis]
MSDRYPNLLGDTRNSAFRAPHNIFDNQARILPVDFDVVEPFRSDAEDKVVVWCSPLLEAYFRTTFARRYIRELQKVYSAEMTRPRRTRKQVLEAVRAVVHAHQGHAEFHHVLTEIAMVQLRCNALKQRHGIIPVALGCSKDSCTFLPELQATDLWLVWENAPQDLDKTFFKLLKRWYSHEISYISSLQRGFDQHRTLLPMAQHQLDARKRAVCDGIIRADGIDKRKSRTKALGNNITSAKSRLHDTATRKMKLLSALGKGNVSTMETKDRNPRRLHGTCEWFKSHQFFKDWQSSASARVLLVTADPGCGKSVLARHLIDDVLRNKASVSYFFFKDDFESQKSLLGALRSILHQILSDNSHLITEDLLARFEDKSLKLDSAAMLWDVLVGLPSPAYSSDLVCVIDALDECGESGGRDLIAKLSEFQESRGANPRLKFLVTSRPYSFVGRPFQLLQQQYPTIHISGDGATQAQQISKEVDLVIKHRIKNLVNLSSAEKQFLLQEIQKVPNRSYLWVNLMLNEIEYMSRFDPESLRKRLGSLPRTIEEAYESVLRRVQQADREDASNILHFIVAAHRPLTVAEMAVAIELQEKHWRARSAVNVDANARFEKFLRVVSGFFIIIVDDRVHLLHQTAREFLISTSGKAASSHDEELVQILIDGGVDLNVQDFGGRTALTIAIERGWDGVVELLVAAGADTETLDHEDMSPLMLASTDTAYRNAFLHILDEDPDLAFANGDGETALLYASHHCMGEYVELLVRRGGFDLNHANNDGNTALHLAAKSILDPIGLDMPPGSEDYAPGILSTLLKHGANPHARNKKGQTPLHLAAEYQYRSLERIESLINYGAPLWAQDSHGRTPLQLAQKVEAVESVGVLQMYMRGWRPCPEQATSSTPNRSAFLQNGRNKHMQMVPAFRFDAPPPTSRASGDSSFKQKAWDAFTRASGDASPRSFTRTSIASAKLLCQFPKLLTMSSANPLQTASDRHIRAVLTALCRKDRKLEREALTMLAHLETFETSRLQAKNSQQPPPSSVLGVKRKMASEDDHHSSGAGTGGAAEICVKCGSAFDSDTNNTQACRSHPDGATTEPDDEGDFWADHDEDCHGIIDSKELREEYPDGYLWTCCGETGSHPGCQIGPHKSRFDPVVKMGH